MSNIKAIIFDLDGVLVEAKDWHYEALNQALGLFGFTISRSDHLVTYDGLPTSKKLNLLSEEQGLPKKLHEFINLLKQKYTLEIINTKCRPVFHHEYALNNLKKDGFRLGCASNSIGKSVEIMLDKSNLLDFMDVILSTDDVKNPKPDPEIYIKSFELLNLKPENCLVIEDNVNGIKSAKSSKAHVMEVREIEEVNYENIKNHIKKIES